MNNRKRTLIISFVFGMLGCLCYGSGDWLMVYGDTSYTGSGTPDRPSEAAHSMRKSSMPLHQ